MFGCLVAFLLGSVREGVWRKEEQWSTAEVSATLSRV